MFVAFIYCAVSDALSEMRLVDNSGDFDNEYGLLTGLNHGSTG